MRMVIKDYSEYGIMVTKDGSAHYIETHAGEVLETFPMGQPTVEGNVVYTPTNDEVWIAVYDYLEKMDGFLNEIIQ